MNGLKDAEEGY